MSAGDILYLTRGNTWDNEQIIVRGGGTESNPAIISSTGTGTLPLITNMRTELSSGDWSDEGSDVWSFALVGTRQDDFKGLWLGGVWATRINAGDSQTPTADLECSYNTGTNKISVYAESVPTTYYGETFYTVNVIGDEGILVYASHILIEEINITESGRGVFVPETSGNISNVTIQGMEYDYVGIGEHIRPLYTAGANSLTDLLLQDSTFTNMGTSACQVQMNVDRFTINNHNVNECGLFQSSASIGTGWNYAGNDAIDENTRNGWVTNCSATGQKYGRFFNDGACYYTDAWGSEIHYRQCIGKDSEGQLYQSNTGYPGNDCIACIGDNVGTLSGEVFQVTDSLLTQESTLILAQNTVVNIADGIDIFKIIDTRGTSTVTVKNNISEGGRYGINYTSSQVDRVDIIDSNNDFYSLTGATIKVDGTTNGTAGADTILTDPELTNYVPATGSPVENAGIFFTWNLEDYNGLKYPYDPSMGAIEYTPSVTRNISTSRTLAETRTDRV